jgi:hypothetical protein
MPSDSAAPFVMTIGLTLLFVGGLLRLWWLAGLGGLIVGGALANWFWPRRVHAEEPA